MYTDWEHPSRLYRVIDGLVYRIGGFVYGNYIRTLRLRGDERILDFGSGSGIAARFLAAALRKGGRLTCLDTSRFWTAVARRRLAGYHNVDFIAGALPEQRLFGGSFEVIFIHYVLHEVRPDQRLATAREFRRVLSDSGKVYIKEPCGRADGIPVAEIRQLFEAAGLQEASFRQKAGTYVGVYTKKLGGSV